MAPLVTKVLLYRRPFVVIFHAVLTGTAYLAFFYALRFLLVGGGVAKDLFERGLCLLPGSNMSTSDLDRVVEVIRSRAKHG